MIFAHFKIETVNSILTKVITNFYMAKRVIKDFKVFKIFIWWKTLSVYLLAYWPVFWTKKALHQMLINMAAYIDDLLTCSSNYQKC